MTRDEVVNRLMNLNDSEGNNVLDMIDGNECGFQSVDGDTLWAFYLGAKELTRAEGESLINEKEQNA